MLHYIVCADGACSGNPGPGGYAWEIWDGVVAEGQEVVSGAGSSTRTTNNIMELSALKGALEALVDQLQGPATVDLHLDSKYCLDGLFKWLPGWKAKGWRKADGKPVLNAEIWKEIDSLAIELGNRGVHLRPDWVKGHGTDVGNVRVDAKAVEMRDAAKSEYNLEIDGQVNAMLAAEGILSFQGDRGEPATLVALSEPDPVAQHGASLGSALTEALDSVSPEQVKLMRSILNPHIDGETSIADVIRLIRQNAKALGCR